MSEESSRKGLITEEGLKQLRDLDGTKLRISKMRIGNELVCKETIKRFVDGVGDVNPLWQDEEYASKTRYKTIVAPPSWLYSVIGPGVQHGLPGVHSFHAGDDWEFYRPILVEDRIKGEAIARGYDEIKESSFAKRMVKQYQDRLYYNQRGELIAKALRWNLRTERAETRSKGRYSQVPLPHPWTEKDIEKIEKEILSEEIRGSQVRYWEDVESGEELPTLVKGPVGVTDEVAWTAGYAPGWLKAHGAALRIYQEHPSWGFRDPETFAMEPVAAVHWSKWAANIAGLPYPYDLGAQRQSWVIQLLCNWMGDEGWLKRCYAEYRSFVFLSDVVWLRGKVVNKYIDESNEYCVEIETGGFNQRGENTIPGRATVILPSKVAGTWPVATRLHEDE
jgi:acyl dehydratase